MRRGSAGGSTWRAADRRFCGACASERSSRSTVASTGSAGRILTRGTPAELKRRIRLGDVIALRLDPPAVPWLGEAPGVLRCRAVDGWVECTVDGAEKRLPDLLRALSAEGIAVRNVRVRE